MRILVLHTYRDPSEESAKRVNALFSKWQPDLPIEGLCDFADGSGGMGIIEVDDPATLLRMTRWATPYVDFTFKMLVPVDQSVPIDQDTIAFWESVS
jgi:hypothetical protein